MSKTQEMRNILRGLTDDEVDITHLCWHNDAALAYKVAKQLGIRVHTRMDNGKMFVSRNYKKE